MFRASLAAYAPYFPARPQVSLNDDLRGGDTFPPADANQIADQCGVIALMRDTQGQVDQPTWYHSLSVIGACVGGEAFAHEWSNGHPKYTYTETTAKLAQAMAFPPTTCAKMHDCQPTICEACVHWGQIKSPIRLGFALAVVVVAPAAQPRVDLPFGFSYTTKNDRYTLCMNVQMQIEGAEKGVMEWQPIPFCDTLFYPVKRIHTDEGDMMEMETRMPQDARRAFRVKSSIVAEGGRAVASEFGRHSIVAYPGHKPKMDAYLTRWMDKLKLDAMEVMSYKRFGWYEDNFLVGTTLVTPEGNEQVLCHGNASRKAAAFQATGDYEIWKQVIDTAYNHEGQEALQYLVVLGFAAPLFCLFKELGGVTVYCHSEGSGVGKTTAQRAALSVWGNWQQLQLADGKTTENALWGLVGTYCNLPVVFDELTNQSNEMASKIVYSVSSGRQRERLGSDGELKDNNSNWSTILMASGNNLLTEKLSLHRNNAEAEISRAFEFTVPHNSRLTPNEARDLFPKLLENYGHAGLEYMEWIVRNREAVERHLFAVQTKFNYVTGITQSERYWSSLQASVITALHICSTLGILQFDKKRMADWIKNETRNSRTQRNESISDPLETMGRMLDDLAQDLLVTHGEGDRRKNADALIIHRPRTALAGRAIIAIDKTERDVLLLSCSSVNTWCNARGASGKELFAAVVAAGWAEAKHERWSLGKGVKDYVTSNVKCWVIYPQQVNAESSNHMVAQRLQLVLNPGVPPHANPTANPSQKQPLGTTGVRN